jgi:hypothetical protein
MDVGRARAISSTAPTIASAAAAMRSALPTVSTDVTQTVS